MTQPKSTLVQIGLTAALAAIVGVVGGFLLAQSLTNCGAANQTGSSEAKVEQPVMVPVVDTAALEKRITEQVTRDVLAKLQATAVAAPAAPAKPAEPTKAAPAPVAPAKEVAKIAPPVKKPTPPPSRLVQPAPAKPQPLAADAGGEPISVAADWKEDIGKYKTQLGDSPAVGPDDALVKVFIVSDFQCPVCRRAAEGMATIFGKNRGKVQFVFWQNPLEMHRKAMPTAKASMAAFAQGNFWDYHDLMFQNQRAANPEDLLNYASQIGLDIERFKSDMESEAILKKILSDQAASVLLGARGTPSFIINGRKQVGWGSAAGIESLVQRELREMEKLIAGGKSRAEALEARVTKNAGTPEEAQAFMKHFIKGEAAQ